MDERHEQALKYFLDGGTAVEEKNDDCEIIDDGSAELRREVGDEAWKKRVKGALDSFMDGSMFAREIENQDI